MARELIWAPLAGQSTRMDIIIDACQLGQELLYLEVDTYETAPFWTKQSDVTMPLHFESAVQQCACVKDVDENSGPLLNRLVCRVSLRKERDWHM